MPSPGLSSDKPTARSNSNLPGCPVLGTHSILWARQVPKPRDLRRAGDPALHSDGDNSINVAELEKEPDRLGRAIAGAQKCNSSANPRKSATGNGKGSAARRGARLTAGRQKATVGADQETLGREKTYGQGLLAGPLAAAHGMAITAVGLEL